MKRTMRAALVVAVAMLLGSAVSAQRAAGRQGGGSQAASSIRIGVGGGLLLPMGTYKDGDKLGWLAGADVTYWLTGGMIGIRAEGSYSQTSHKAPATGNTKPFGGMAGAGLGPGASAGQIAPFAPAGLGVCHAAEGVTRASGTKSRLCGWRG